MFCGLRQGFDCSGGFGGGRCPGTTAPVTAQRVSEASGLKAFRPLPYNARHATDSSGLTVRPGSSQGGCTSIGPGSSCRAGAGIICPSLPSRPGAGRDDGSTVNSGGQSRSPRRWSDPSPLKGSRSTPSTALWQWGLQARLSYQENSVPALDHS